MGLNALFTLGPSGARDWAVQRVTAVIVAAYTLFLLVFWCMHAPLTYTAWHGLFANQWMKIATLLAVIAIAKHARIGMLTILTDYVKSIPLRWVLEVAVVLGLVACVIWTLLILW